MKSIAPPQLRREALRRAVEKRRPTPEIAEDVPPEPSVESITVLDAQAVDTWERLPTKRKPSNQQLRDALFAYERGRQIAKETGRAEPNAVEPEPVPSVDPAKSRKKKTVRVRQPAIQRIDRRTGRLHDLHRRDTRMTFSCSQYEAEEMIERARQEGMNFSAWVRMKLLR